MCALPATPLSGTAVLAAPGADHARVLAAALGELRLPLPPAHLTLLSYAETKIPEGVSLTAVIRLTWPPGERTRSFEVTCSQVDQGHAALLSEVKAVFCCPVALNISRV